MTRPVIAQIVQHMAPGGIETMVLDLQSQASSPEHVHIISLEGSFQKAVNHWPRLADKYRLHFLGKRPGFQYRTMLQLAYLLKQLNVSIIHTHHAGPLLYGGIAAKLARCKHIHTEHDAWHLDNLKRRILVGTCFHLLRPEVVADAKLVAESVRHHIPLSSPNVVMNGIDTERFCPGDQTKARQQIRLPENVRIVGCAARFSAVKSLHLLIDAITRMPDDIHLALAGGGELEDKLRQQVSELNIDHRVHFVGMIDDMPQFYRAIDIFCMTSQREGLPSSSLEAQACGRTVVLSDVGGCREAVDPKSGVLVPYGESKLLDQGILHALKSGITLSSRTSAREFVEKYGNLKRMIRKYESLYQGGML